MEQRGVHPLVEELAMKTREEMTLPQIVEAIKQAERGGREIAAGGMLIHLKRQWYGAKLLFKVKGDDEGFLGEWGRFIEENFMFSPERAEALMGRLLHRGGMLRCTGCGAQALCACGCGVDYWPDSAEKPVTKPVTKDRGGRPAIGERPMTAAERKRKSRERQRAVAMGTVQENDGLTPAHRRENYQTAFMLRAERIRDLAAYDETEAPISDDIVESAVAASAAWTELVGRLKQRRTADGKRNGKARTPDKATKARL